MEPFAHQQLMRAFLNPRTLRGKQDWITWVFQLKAKTDAKYALEFGSGWDGWRVLVAGAVPWIASCLTAVLWSVWGGDLQSGLAVASFILAASGGRFYSKNTGGGYVAMLTNRRCGGDGGGSKYVGEVELEQHSLYSIKLL